MTEQNHSEPVEESESVFKTLLPYLVSTGLVTALVTLLVIKLAGSFGGAVLTGGGIVTFDTIKYTNSTRAVASAFLKGSDAGADAESVLLNLPERVRASITKVAGSGTLVMVKQGIVQGQARDITDAVLKDLGLPIVVPTDDPTAYSLDIAPTQLSNFPQAPKRSQPASAAAQPGERVVP